ncbi:acyl carrier protein [Taklimakanibacter lacteus]|uniref:acyl carrier protein n=1 Tax=Taklimakanibacter lacteus TaxID=2268456 RepID=UPI000E6649E3
MNRDEVKMALLDVLVAMELITPSEKSAALGEGAADIHFGGLGIDSLAVVDMCVAVEEKIGRELHVEEIIDNPTVDLLAAHLGSAADK